MIIDGHHHIENDYNHILRRMDELGIDKTVLVGVGVRDLSVVTVKKSPVISNHFLLKTMGVLEARKLVRSRELQESLLGDPLNDKVLKAIKEKPDRFEGFAFVNPESEQAGNEIEFCLKEGMKGIKLALLQYPTDLSGPKMAEICEIAEEKNVPIFFHQGLTRESSDASKMVKSFKNVTFIVAHAGVQYFYNAVDLAMDYENVFVDTSSYIVTFRKLEYLCRKIGAEKLIFGTDVPVMSNDPSEGLEKIRRLPISESDKELILGNNLWEILERSKK